MKTALAIHRLYMGGPTRQFNICKNGFAEKALLDDRTVPSQMAGVEQSELLDSILECQWSQHKTDVVSIKSVQPVQIKLMRNVQLPYKRQYPLSSQAVQGMKTKTTKTTSPCNSPIFPIKKPHSPDYRLVHDLRAVNAVVDAETPVVPDPHILLSNITRQEIHVGCD